jgi:hypothetical protein
LAILNSFLNALATGDNVRDFRHASRTFVDGNYRLAPKHRFLFHVVFGITPGLGFTFGGRENLEASFLVKSVDLPRYTYDLVEHNQYNRKRYHMNKINYEPVRITFHDDNSDVIRNMWYAYYAYYNNDPGYESTSAYLKQPKEVYQNLNINSQRWGLDRNTGQFFNYIKIYSIYQKKYTEYWLVNPIIDSFEHDRHDYADSQGTLEHQMSVRFETVKYRTGLVQGDGPAGFGDMHYDTAASPLTPQGGGTTSIFGPGGVVDAVGSIGSDLAGGNLAGAVVTGLRGAQNLKGANLGKMLKSELTGAAMNALRGQNPVGDFSFPNSSGAGNPLPQVPKVVAVGGNQIPSGQNRVSSNGAAIQSNIKQPLQTPNLSLQSLQNGANQAFDFAKGMPDAIASKFASISPYVSSAEFQTQYNNDLATAQDNLNQELPGATQQVNDALARVDAAGGNPLVGLDFNRLMTDPAYRGLQANKIDQIKGGTDTFGD